MAAPEKQLKIAITTTADTSGAKEAQKSVESLEDASRKYKEENRKINEDFKNEVFGGVTFRNKQKAALEEVNAATAKIGPTAKMSFGQATAAAGPYVAAAMAIREALQMVTGPLNEANDIMQGMGKDLPAGMRGTADAIRVLNTAVNTLLNPLSELKKVFFEEDLKGLRGIRDGVEEMKKSRAEMEKQRTAAKERADALADKRVLDTLQAEREELDRQFQLLQDAAEVAKARAEAIRVMQGLPETPQGKEAAGGADRAVDVEVLNGKLVKLQERIVELVTKSTEAAAEGNAELASQIDAELVRAGNEKQRLVDQHNTLVEKNQIESDKLFTETTRAMEEQSAANVQKVLDAVDTTGLNDQQQLALQQAQAALADGRIAAGETAGVNASMAQLFSAMRASTQEQHSLIKAMQDDFATIAQRQRELWDRQARNEQLMRASGFSR